MTYLPSSCIENCDALEEVNVSADNSSFCSVNGVIYTKDMKSLVLYPQAKQGVYTVPATLTSLSYKDIFKTTNYPLVTAYGISAFDVESGNTAFGVDARGILYSSDMKKLFAYPLADTAEELIINDENTNSIQSYAFANNKYLNSFKFTSDNGYQSILGYAFYNTKIKNIEMKGIYSLEEITEVKVKDGTVGITAHALNKLTVDKLSLPESVKYLSYRALAESTPTEFTYHNNFEYIANSAFSQFGYVGGILDIGTPTYVGDYAIGYTKFLIF